MSGSPIKRERRERLQAMLADEVTVMQKITDFIAEGQGLTSWCRIHDVPNSTVHAWITASPERKASYEQARILGANALVEQSLRVYDEVRVLENGSTDSGGVNLAKAKSETMRWIAARIAPKDWGESIQVSQSIDFNIRELLNRREAALTSRVIESNED